MNLCVLIPTYNNANTLANVIERALSQCPDILVVNDGSTDGTAEILDSFAGNIKVISYTQNKGKGYALKQGFLAAKEAGYTHVITMDADGQHFPEDIPLLKAESEKNPDAIIVGSRNLKADNMPSQNTFANRFSNFWFHLQTGNALPDTQTGFRIYPLQGLAGIKWMSRRYEAELLLLVINAWKGKKLIPVTINVFYPSKEERITHFHPLKDFFRISVLNTILTFLAVFFNKRLFVIALAIFFIILSAIGISKVHMEEDIAQFLPSDPQADKYLAIYQNLAGQNRGVIIVCQEEKEDTSSAKATSTTDIMDELGQIITGIDSKHEIRDMQVVVNEESWLESATFMSKNAPYFLEEEDYAHIDSLLADKEFIPHQLENAREMLGLPTGSVVANTLPYDPLSLFSGPIQRLQKLNTNSGNIHLDGGHLMSSDGSHGFILFNSPYGVSESAGNKHIAQIIDTAADSLKPRYSSAKVYATGAPIIAAGNAGQIKKDCILAVSLAIILILGILLYAFKSIKSLILMAIALGFGWLIALGGVSLFKDNLSIIVLGIGSVVIGIAANYPLHFLHHLKHEANRKLALREIAPPLIVGNITTVSAFACLCFIHAEAMRDLGLFASLMLVGTILFVIFVLPAMPSKILPSSALAPSDHENKKGPFKKNPKIPHKVQVFLLIIFSIATIGLTVKSFDTGFDANMQHINYMTPEQREGLELLAGTDSKDAAIDQKAYATLFIVKDGRKEQQLRLKRWKEFWSKHADVIPTLRAAAAAQDFEEDAFAPFENCIQNEHEIQDARFFAPFISSDLGGQIMQENEANHLQYISQVKVETTQAKQVKEQLSKSLNDEGFVFDSTDVSNRLVSILSDNFNYIGWVCSIVVFIFLWLSLGRIELSILSFLPLAIAWVWIIGLMNITNVQFNIVNIILATFIFGQGDDYTIFITEGLMYENAYGRSRLNTYKKSILLSAVIMFIGIGVLIFAKHPALKSLAEVAIIGMIMVVIMACWLPPIIYKWLTTAHGKPREIPLTLPRLLRSIFALLWAIVWMVFLMTPLCFILSLIDKKGNKTRTFVHNIAWRFSRFSCRHIPGIKTTINNKSHEDFSKPAIIVCNHQSHLEIMHIMSLTPKLVIMTNHWVWHNPIYGNIIHRLEFYPTDNGYEGCHEQMRKLAEMGYSIVIFPEGTRSPHCDILRFHQGAIKLAQQLKLDILPLYLHGAGHTLPKYDFMLRKGNIYLEIGQRIHVEASAGEENLRQITHALRQKYIAEYKRIRKEREDFAYWTDFVYHKYIYKSLSIARNARLNIRKAKTQEKEWKERLNNESSSLFSIDGSDNGELAWLLALCYPDTQFKVTFTDDDARSIAQATACKPDNLIFS